MILDSEFLKFLEKMKIAFKLNYNSGIIGERVSNQRGSGMDFKDYRHYEIGDDYRYIDWNLYSRLEQLYLKEFIEEKGSSIYLMIDNSESMSIGKPSKIDKAVQIAAALGYIGLTQMDRVGVAYFSDQLNSVSRLIKGKNQVNNLFHVLESVKTTGETDISRSIASFVHRFKKPGVAIIISDLITDQDFFQGIKILKMQGWKVLVIQLLADEDLNPAVGENLNLIDAETNERKEIYIDEELLANYQNNVEDYNSSIKSFVKEFGISYYRTYTKQDLKDIIYQLLGIRREIS